MKDKTKISWMALRYENETDNIHLQIGLAFIMGCILVGTIIFKNYLLGVIVITSAILMKNIKKKESEYIPIEINNRGISINNEFAEYEKFICFFIDDTNEENDYLLLKSKGTIFKDISVVIIESEVDIEELRNFLSQRLTEKEIKQNSTDKLMNAF